MCGSKLSRQWGFEGARAADASLCLRAQGPQVIGPFSVHRKSPAFCMGGGRQVCFVLEPWLNPHIFTAHRNLLDIDLAQLNAVLESQSLSTHTRERVVDEKSLTSVKPQLVIEHSRDYLFLTYLNSEFWLNCS